jgi:WD40 repeat protein
MTRVRRICLALMLVSVLTARWAVAEEPLVPDGESLDILQGVAWAPMWGLRSVAATADGTTFASVSDDGVLRLWDSSGRMLRRFPAGTSGQTAVAFSGDGRVVVAGRRDGSLQAWDANTGRDAGHRDGDGTPIAVIAVNADGHSVVFAGSHSAALLWHPGAKAEPTPVLENAGEARAAQFGGPGGKLLALALASRAVILIDADSMKARPPIGGFSTAPTALAFTADNGTLAVGTESGAVQLVGVGDGKIVRTIEAHSQAVTGLRFAIDGVLATTAADHGIRIWSAATGQELHRLTTEDCCANLAVVQGGRTLVAASPHRLLRWDVSSGAQLADIVGPPSPATGVSADGAGRFVLTGSADGSTRLFDVASGLPKQHWQLAGTVAAVALSADGKVAAAASERTVVLWESETGKETLQVEGHEGAVLSVALSSDGSRLLTGSADRTARIWDTKSGKQLALATAGGAVSALALTSDGATFATATASGVRLWSTDHATEGKHLPFDGEPTALAFAKDGKRLAVGLVDGSVHLYDTTTGTQVSRFSGQKDRITGVGLTADGKKLIAASKDDTLRMWNVEGGADSGKLEKLTLGATGLALSGNDAFAAVCTGEGATYVWTLAEQKTRLSIRQGAGGWLSVAKDRVLRGDDGQWLLRAEGENEPLLPVAPKLSASANPPDLSLEVEGVATVVEGGRPGTPLRDGAVPVERHPAHRAGSQRRADD